jgi:hypothetical protein
MQSLPGAHPFVYTKKDLQIWAVTFFLAEKKSKNTNPVLRLVNLSTEVSVGYKGKLREREIDRSREREMRKTRKGGERKVYRAVHAPHDHM